MFTVHEICFEIDIRHGFCLDIGKRKVSFESNYSSYVYGNVTCLNSCIPRLFCHIYENQNFRHATCMGNNRSLPQQTDRRNYSIFFFVVVVPFPGAYRQ